MKILLLSTYPPRKCGIGEYAHKVAAHLRKLTSALHVAAIVTDDLPYPPEVVFKLRRDVPEDYGRAAEFINRSRYDVVVLQHEYSLYGGHYGDWVLSLVSRIRKPLVSVIHTLIPGADASTHALTRAIVAGSNVVVATTSQGRLALQASYGAAPGRAIHIPLGASGGDLARRGEYRRHYGIENRAVAVSYGLLHPYKGIEFVIDAIPRFVHAHPSFLFWVVGGPHPDNPESAAYYDRLVEKTRAMGLEQHVQFIPGYQSEEDLTRRLIAADLYINPHKEIGHIFASATLTHAARMGKPILSSPLGYAQELISGDGGILFPFEDAQAIAESLNRLLENGALREQFGSRMHAKGLSFAWENVAAAYRDVAAIAAKDGRRKGDGAGEERGTGRSSRRRRLRRRRRGKRRKYRLRRRLGGRRTARRGRKRTRSVRSGRRRAGRRRASRARRGKR